MYSVKFYFRLFKTNIFGGLLSIVGLIIGLASVLLIVSYIKYEFSFDKHFGKFDRIGLLALDSEGAAGSIRTILVPEPLGNTIQQEFSSNVEEATSIRFGSTQFHVNDNPTPLRSIQTTKTFFKVFDFEFVEGRAQSAFQTENSVVLTESVAKSIFGSQPALGKLLTQKGPIGENQFLSVSGVIKEIPDNTHFDTDVILLLPSTNVKELNFKAYSGIQQYLLFRRSNDVDGITDKLIAFGKKYGRPDKMAILIIPLTKIRLYSTSIISNDLKLGDIKYIYIFGSSAILILLIALGNQANFLSTIARHRLKEVGIRTILGGNRQKIIGQLIFENFILFGIAYILSILLTIVLWRYFKNVIGINISFSALLDSKLFALSFVIFVFFSILSTIKASLYMLKFGGINALRNYGNWNFSKSSKVNFSLVLQYAIFSMLLLSTFIIWKQLRLFNERPLGFDKEQLLILGQLGGNGNFNAFKNELLSHSGITNVSFVNAKIGDFSSTASMPDFQDNNQSIEFAFIFADTDYLRTMGVKVPKGRLLSNLIATDVISYDSLSEERYKTAESDIQREIALDLPSNRPIIVTAAFVKKMGISKPLNTVIRDPAIQGRIVGVANDFQLSTLKQRSPLIVYRYTRPNRFSSTYIRLANSNLPSTISSIEKSWKKYFPDSPFKYTFASEDIQRFYQYETRLAFVFSIFSVVSTALTILGLLSLLMINMKERTKELGIRIILGATFNRIVALIAKDYITSMSIGLFLGIAVAAYACTKWLNNFALKVSLSWWIFAYSLIIIMLISLVVLYGEIYRTLRKNPVDSLRTE